MKFLVFCGPSQTMLTFPWQSCHHPFRVGRARVDYFLISTWPEIIFSGGRKGGRKFSSHCRKIANTQGGFAKLINYTTDPSTSLTFLNGHTNYFKMVITNSTIILRFGDDFKLYQRHLRLKYTCIGPFLRKLQLFKSMRGFWLTLSNT